jgi:zinc protease
MLNRTIPPTIYAPTTFEFRLPPCSKQLLDNGIPLYYVNDCVEEVAQVELVFPAGLWYESKIGVAQAAMSLLKSGTSQWSSFQINEMFEQYGASVKTAAGNDWASVSISCLTKHLSKLLPIISTLLQDAVFPEHELEIYKQNTKQRLAVQLKKSNFVANRAIDTYLFGKQHPYGKYSEMADVDAITCEDLIYHVQQFITPSSCKIFLAGKFTNHEISAINAAFGKSTMQHATLEQPNHLVSNAVEKKYRITNDPNGVQGSIRLIRSFPDKHHPDFTPMIVLNTVFGGYFGSRLMSNIREEKGYTYGIHSYLYNNVHDGAFIITTEAGKDVCEETIQEIYYEMEMLRQQKMDQEELQLVKNYLLGTILGDLDGAFQIIQRWKNIILNGFEEDRFYKNIEVYKNISPDELQHLANVYLQKDDFYELVVV